MKYLADVAQNRAGRAALVADIAQLIDRRVATVRGLSGVAIRGGYAVVSKMKGGRMIPGAVNHLLDDFCAGLDPFVAQWHEGETARFREFLGGKERIVADALLSITDARAQRASALLRRPYNKLRKFGETQVAMSVPDIADIAQNALSDG